ncbi:MAG: ABC transporter ATP-binding protein [Armatimonadetes bacterium]|nr:ABC transporter ATP-binding protein [Armatimonadota bacterium]MDE2206436.1 ABC transporter ATP-binding protein [Armatimonadota bacterium]
MADSANDAIVVDHLVKRFEIRHRGSLKLAILGVIRKQRVERLTALNDVSFTVPHGQTVAVIGRNGSGKSTLLGILARVYKPTSGVARLTGRDGGIARVAPLLELGAGFHPDLTGLENIDFYGAVLGMTPRDIRDQLDAIVAFAELPEKVDTKLRGWNEGAKLRLGFAIAVHTRPDILLVDEVLAVGDEPFQNKCYGRIREMQATGTTILFVSHDLAVVSRVAERTIWLSKGVIERDGPTATVVQDYRDDAARSGVWLA